MRWSMMLGPAARIRQTWGTRGKVNGYLTNACLWLKGVKVKGLFYCKSCCCQYRSRKLGLIMATIISLPLTSASKTEMQKEHPIPSSSLLNNRLGWLINSYQQAIRWKRTFHPNPHQWGVFHHYCASPVHTVFVWVQHMGPILTEGKWLLIPGWH